MSEQVKPVDLYLVKNRADQARKICNVSIGLVDTKANQLCDDIDALCNEVEALRARVKELEALRGSGKREPTENDNGRAGA